MDASFMILNLHISRQEAVIVHTIVSQLYVPPTCNLHPICTYYDLETFALCGRNNYREPFFLSYKYSLTYPPILAASLHHSIVH